MHLKILCPDGAELVVDGRLVLGRGKGFPNLEDIPDEVLALEPIAGIEDAVNLHILGLSVVTVESREDEAAASTSAPDASCWKPTAWMFQGESVPVGIRNRFFLAAKPSIVLTLAAASGAAAAGARAPFTDGALEGTTGIGQAGGATTHRTGYVLTTGVPESAPSASSAGAALDPPNLPRWREMGFQSEAHAREVLCEDQFQLQTGAAHWGAGSGAGRPLQSDPDDDPGDSRRGMAGGSLGSADAGRPGKRQRLASDSRSDATAAAPSCAAEQLAQAAPIGGAAAAGPAGAHPARNGAGGATNSGGQSQASAQVSHGRGGPGAAGSAAHTAQAILQPATAVSTSAKPLNYVDAPFALMWIQYQQEYPFNHGCFGLKLLQVVCGKLELALVSNMDIDVPWLFTACPDLREARKLVIVFDGGDDNRPRRDAFGQRPEEARDEACKRARMMREVTEPLFSGEQLVVHAPRVREFGKHHSKFFILLYSTGIRVIILTANLQFPDCNNKTQGIWYQDFPPKDASSPKDSEFETDLWEYLQALELPQATAAELQAAVGRHDFTSARAALVASVPGFHRGARLERNGHRRVRWLLEREEFSQKFCNSPISCQFSSLGALDRKWLLEEFIVSLSGGTVPQRECPAQLGADALRPSPSKPASLGVPLEGGVQLIWPTRDEVRQSHEGWVAGGSLPGRKDNVDRGCLKQHWHRWGGAPAHRQRAMPHIKTYCRYRQSEVAWFMVGSHNLSKAAWGQLQNSRQTSDKQLQLFVRSYELSVLLLPRLEAAHRSHRHYGFVSGPIGLAAWTALDGTTVSPLLACPSSLLPDVGDENPAANDDERVQPTAPPSPTTPAAARAAGHAGVVDRGAAQAVENTAAQVAVESLAAGTPVKASPSLAPSSRQPKSRSDAVVGLAVSFVAANQPVRGGIAPSGRRRGAAALPGREGRAIVVPLPVPYTLPPERYHGDDRPWIADELHEGLDAHGFQFFAAFQAAVERGMHSQELIFPYYEDNNSAILA